MTVEETGTVGVAGTYTTESGTGRIYRYDDWGLWGRQFGENIFGAFIEQNVTRNGDTTTYATPTTRIDGTPSGQNPISGGAVWSGSVRAFETTLGADKTPVSGDARLEVNFDNATVDVDFTNLEAGHDDMSWSALQIASGAFRDKTLRPTIEGAFYGSAHQGAAGKFDRDGLRGVFGAVR